MDLSHCARFVVTTQQLICRVIYLGQYVTSHDLRLMSNVDQQFKVIMHIVFRCALTRGPRLCPNYVASFLSSTVICIFS